MCLGQGRAGGPNPHRRTTPTGFLAERGIESFADGLQPRKLRITTRWMGQGVGQRVQLGHVPWWTDGGKAGLQVQQIQQGSLDTLEVSGRNRFVAEQKAGDRLGLWQCLESTVQSRQRTLGTRNLLQETSRRAVFRHPTILKPERYIKNPGALIKVRAPRIM